MMRTRERNRPKRAGVLAASAVWIGIFLWVGGVRPSEIPPDLSPPTAADVLAPILGPAVDEPHEVLELLDQRKRALDKREEAVRIAEARLEAIKNDVEQMLTRYEESVQAAQASQAAEKQKRMQAEELAKRKRAEAEAAAYKANLLQVSKIYETMPPEEAAVRIEKMPTPMALRVLRSVKSKTAAAILSAMNPEKAAKLTERFLATVSSTDQTVR